jgi:hypothetical protein
MLFQLLLISSFAYLTVGQAAALKGPWLEVIEWVNRDGENCPNLGATNGTGEKALNVGDSGFAYDTNNVTYKKREFFEVQISADCIYLVG